MKGYLLNFDEIILDEDSSLGTLNIRIDGDWKGPYKFGVIDGIRKVLSKYQGKAHLFVDDKEVNPYK